MAFDYCQKYNIIPPKTELYCNLDAKERVECSAGNFQTKILEMFQVAEALLK